MRNRHGRFDRLKAGNNRDGTSRAFAKGNEPTLSTHHDPNEARAGDVGIAPGFMKPAARKAMHPVSVHNGMHPRAVAAAGLGGQGHGTATIDGGQTVVSSAAAAPIASAYGGGILKVRDAAKPAWGNRSRTGGIAQSLDDPTLTELGRAVKDEC
jgi:hypothetical protein